MANDILKLARWREAWGGAWPVHLSKRGGVVPSASALRPAAGENILSLTKYDNQPGRNRLISMAPLFAPLLSLALYIALP